MQFGDAVRSRRMTRAFSSEPVGREVIEKCVALASRAPSAGKTQGWRLVVLEGAETRRFWDATLPGPRRDGFAWPRLLDAPVVMIPVADPGAYLDRYSEPDKSATGLGESPDRWPVPYWTVDASFAVMTLLLALHDEGLGALFFGVFRGESELRDVLGIPADVQILGAIAAGRPMRADERPGRSAGRRRLPTDEIIGWGRMP